MRALTIALLGFLVLAGPACQAQTSTPPAHVEAGPAARAGAAMEAGRYAEAVAVFREALARTPESVALRYGLAVALSYTDRGAAIREFQWVMANAQPGSQERVESQAWLARAGALPSVPAASSRSAEPEREVGNAVLVGRALFAEAGAKPEPMRRLQLFLMGQPDSPTKEGRYVLRTDEDGNFKFPDVLPGPYMLTNRLAGQPIWRLRVELKPAEEKQLDLNPGNSVAVRDDFPQGR
ncbi:MAG TPA: carboxypeptidase-like regulatory domain-containing protein [Methylomirabilota bacterium]|nr:carboxypeptidase-like regulatory domain-containing protein [Methylomirabilota bacterium]